MDQENLDSRIFARGEQLLKRIEGEKPSVFERRRWVGRMIEWSMQDQDFRTQLLRFVDVFPSLSTPDMIAGHVREYFGDSDAQIPSFLKWGINATSLGGPLGSLLLSKGIGYGIRKLGRQFILGETERDAIRMLSKVRSEGCAFSLDILGEAVLSEDEAEHYSTRYMALLDSLGQAQTGWPPLGSLSRENPLDWGYSPKIGISLKPTSLYSQARPQDFDGSVAGIVTRLLPICRKAVNTGAALCIDMEAYEYKDISLEVFKKLRLEFPDYPYLSIAVQSYLRDTDKDLSDLIEWAGVHGLSISVRLVKGAYWDYEMLRARQTGWEIPVYTKKAETDAAFERHARLILENHKTACLACGSHNIRSIAAVIETARDLWTPEERYEFQILYGMAEPVRKALLASVGRVREYCPYGPIIPGMAYLVRRLLENTANQGFLRRMFAERTDPATLLLNPAEEIRGKQDKAPPAGERTAQPGDLSPFINQPPSDFTSKEERERFAKAITGVRQHLGKTCPLYINGMERITKDTLPSLNPADPEEIIAHVCQAGAEEAEYAIRSARESFDAWRDTEPRTRAGHLLRAASWMRSRRQELAAWQTLEIGKQWDQASADVAEAIDFLEYYAREMMHLAVPRKLASPPGEQNHCVYEPRGVTVVIAPWNFPLAISCGMVSAALVTGNCVVYKPSPLTPVVGRHLVEAFREAGLPAGVFNFVPGRTEVIAEYLVDHPDVSTVAFTGSTEVGLKIIEKTAVVRPGQMKVKRIICEMGGKNAIIIDADADLDQAIPAVLVSAFGFQGQKCSSCSRVIVLESIYDEFVDRLARAADSLAIGPAENPAFYMGPVADDRSRTRILKYIETAGREGKIIYSGTAPTGGGSYVPVTIAAGIRPEHTTSQEEVFGPLLAVMKVSTFDQALEWANSTRFALTGGVFSRSPRNLEKARKRFLVGNLYLNRHITGALVGRQPFGGFKLSGLGTKAGGPEYLLHFMDPRVITENTARRGFAPEVE